MNVPKTDPDDVVVTAAAVPESDTRPPLRLGIAIAIGVIMWVAPFVGFSAVLLPARLAVLAPDDKVAIVASLAVVGSIVALLANIFFGALSDLTRSRFGRRAPWMIVGSIGSFASLAVVASASSLAALTVGWCCFQFFLNAIVAPIVTVIPDRVPSRMRGSYSAVYGVSLMVGMSLAQLVASRFVTDPQQGMWVFAFVVLFAGPVFAVIAPDVSNKDVPKVPFSGEMIVRNFVFPLKNARDFYLALIGKLLLVLGTFAITGYQLYILTDYMNASTKEAGDVIAVMSIISLVTGLIFGSLAGPFSDKIGRRKAPVIGSALLIALGTLVPFFFAEAWALIVFALIAGIGSGVFNSVDQALNYEVLPDPETAAKDLGILNMANTGGQILGPVVTSAIVAVTASYGAVFLAAAGILVLSAAAIKPIKKAR